MLVVLEIGSLEWLVKILNGDICLCLESPLLSVFVVVNKFIEEDVFLSRNKHNNIEKVSFSWF